MDEINSPPWFKDGLSFKCTGCGGCCTGAEGYVFISDFDTNRLATHLSLPQNQFLEQYTRIVEEQLVLKDLPNANCIFLKENKCSVYEARPIQCRTFPWWIDNIRTEEAWTEAAQFCEGINHPDSTIVPATEIVSQCSTYLDNLLEKNFL